MSKERARRRAEREAAEAAARQKRARTVRRRARRRALTAPVTRVAGGAWSGLRRATWGASPLTRRRRAQDAALLAVLVMLNVLVWVFEPSWTLRWVLLGVCVIAWPLLVVLLFNRRPSG